jgi:hypothetical protein
MSHIIFKMGIKSKNKCRVLKSLFLAYRVESPMGYCIQSTFPKRQSHYLVEGRTPSLLKITI